MTRSRIINILLSILARRLSWILSLSLLISSIFSVEASDICGRTATVNYQEILVDTTSTKKGEGLRYYIEKDPIAKQYLDEYQKKNTPKWQNAVIGTIGTALFIYGMGSTRALLDSDPGSIRKRSFMIGGLSILVLNFLLVRTLEHNNERLLLRSIEEYNKRNLPRIYFAPYEDYQNTNRPSSDSLGLSTGIIKEF